MTVLEKKIYSIVKVMQNLGLDLDSVNPDPKNRLLSLHLISLCQMYIGTETTVNI